MKFAMGFAKFSSIALMFAVFGIIGATVGLVLALGMTAMTRQSQPTRERRVSRMGSRRYIKQSSATPDWGPW